MRRENPWSPMTCERHQTVLALLTLGATLAVWLELPESRVAWVTMAAVLAAYFAALLAQAARSARIASVIPNGALRGSGYVGSFRKAKKSLLLMHTDDDKPSDELMGLYRTLLEDGIEIRRILILRPDHQRRGFEWIRATAPHPRLRQRIATMESSATAPLSFGIVDEECAMLALPSSSPIESEAYSEEIVLRNLIEFRDTTIVRAFLESYEVLWRRAQPLDPVQLPAA